MFQSYNYNFTLATQANLDEADLSAYCLQKNTSLDQYNLSPSSLECSPESKEHHIHHDLDNSFEKDSQASHAQQVWSASVEYLHAATHANEQGFNNDSLYRSYNPSQPATAPLADLIKTNRLFRVQERKSFMEDLEKEAEVCSLLVELMVLFNHKIFNEVAYVVYRIWSSRYSAFRAGKKMKSPLIASFSNFFGFEDEEKGFGNSAFLSDETNTAEIVAASTEGIEELAKQLFLSKKLKHINLQELRSTNLNRSESMAEFTLFVKAISKAVFLSAEGVYEQETEVSSFSEEEGDDSFGTTGPKFARLFSQLQEDGEEAYAPSAPTKYRKLQ